MKLISYCKVCFTLLLTLVSCSREKVELINPNTQSLPYDIIINGGILTMNGKQFVQITKPLAWITDTVMPVSGAVVELSDGENTYLYKETSKPGEYETVLDIKGEVGKVYTLKVSFNGKLYLASDSLIEAKPISVDEIPIEEIDYDETGRIYTHMHTHIFGFETSNIWIINKQHIDSLGNLFLPQLCPKRIIRYDYLPVYTHKGVLHQGLFPSGFTSIGNAGAPEDTTEYAKLSVSDSYYKYLISIFNITERSSGLFSTTLGNALTNVSNGGAGYFFASDVKTIKVQYKDLTALSK